MPLLTETHPDPIRRDPTERLPAALTPARSSEHRPARHLGFLRPDPVVVEVAPEPSPEIVAALRARRRHQARMDMWTEARAGAWFIFAVITCGLLVVVGTLLVGWLLGRWPLPMGGAS